MRRSFRHLIIGVYVFVAIFILGAIFMYAPSANRVSAGADTGYVLAKIGPYEVTNDQFAGLLQQYERMYEMMPVSAQGSLLGQTYESIIHQYAMADAAKAAGVNVSTADAQAEAQRELDQWLETVGKGLKPEERERYRSIRRAQLDLEQIRRGLMAQRLQEKLQKDARPVEVKVAHVLIKTDTIGEAAALKKAQDVTRQARAGADFAGLAKQHSDDTSKEKGGEVGWASAMPPDPPVGKDAKPDPNAATRLVPEFTAAALRLRPGQVSDPVRSQFGYHVVKALEEREYQPKDPAVVKDPKKKSEAVEQYRTTLASQIQQGLLAEHRAKLEQQVVPHSAWLRGHLAEQSLGFLTPPTGKDGKPLSADEKKNAVESAKKLEAVTTLYAEAMNKHEPVEGPALGYHMGELYKRTAEFYTAAGEKDQAKRQYELAAEVLQKWSQRGGGAETYQALGETLQKLDKKSDAVAAYEKAVQRAYNNPFLLGELADKLKDLGRDDLAESARKKQAEVQARQDAEQKAQQAAQKKQDEEMKKAAKAAEAKAAAEKAASAPKAPEAKETRPAAP
jgi:parvulin-like peptidyl-prolyl isomerase